MLRPTLLCLCMLLGAFPTSASAQSGANVLVVASKTSTDSIEVAEQYARARSVPADQVLRLEMEAADEVERDVYERQIQAPIAAWLARNAAQDRILYIVLAKGVPLRIRGTAGREGTTASVDSELTLLYRRLAGIPALFAGPIPNPYYLANASVAVARPFSHATQDIYLVARLDGYTLADVLGLIERGGRPAREGRIVLDQRASLSDAAGNQWLQSAADALAGSGFGSRVMLETTSRVASGEKDVLGYYSWGSNDPARTSRHLDLGFVPGAIGGQFVSTDARTFKEPPPGWTTAASWGDRTKFYAGSPQSLTGDLVRDGITGAAGYVAEPFLDATVRPNVLFPAYLSGFNLVEAFYLAMPVLSWQAVVVGDPLCAPFTRPSLQAGDIDKGIDAATELPGYFAARRLRALTAEGRRPEAAKLMMRAEARGVKGDKPGALKALEEATSIDPRLNAAQLMLASEYEAQGQYDLAIERYRTMLEGNPRDPIALNNLAYALAVRKGQPAEALPLAERAFALTPSATVADTLGWVQHLLGRDQDAARLLGNAARQLPRNGEIRLHAAVAFAAVGMLEVAEKELAEAVRLDATLDKTPEAHAVREKVRK